MPIDWGTVNWVNVGLLSVARPSSLSLPAS